MRLATLPAAIATGIGLVVTLYSGYLTVKGPFLGRGLLEPELLLVTLGVFLVGVIVLTWGAVRLTRLARLA